MNNDQHRWLDMIDNYVSICKRNKKLVECRRPKKSIYRRYKEYLQTLQKLVECRPPKKHFQRIRSVFADHAKSIADNTKKYWQAIQKGFADDTGNLPEETTIRDREFAYTTACLVEGQFFVCGTSLCLFSRVFFGTSLCLFSTCIFFKPWQKCIYLSDPSPIIGNACQWLTDSLTNWLTHSCLVNLSLMIVHLCH